MHKLFNLVTKEQLEQRSDVTKHDLIRVYGQANTPLRCSKEKRRRRKKRQSKRQDKVLKPQQLMQKERDDENQNAKDGLESDLSCTGSEQDLSDMQNQQMTMLQKLINKYSFNQQNKSKSTCGIERGNPNEQGEEIEEDCHNQSDAELTSWEWGHHDDEIAPLNKQYNCLEGNIEST